MLIFILSFFLSTPIKATEQEERFGWALESLAHLALGSEVDHDYKDVVASVRVGSQLPEEEKKACTLRKKNAHKKLEALLGISLKTEEIPTIALCCSGGGYRALISTLGSLMACEELGLLDCITYVAGVSGSTWTMGTWFAHKKSLPALKELLIQQLQKTLTAESSYQRLLELARIKYRYDQKFTLVDVWGALIAKTLLSDFGDQRQSCHLSHQSVGVESGTCPFPIYTAIIPVKNTYQWVEFTPYEMGNLATQTFIPTWSLGRKFTHGISQDYAPEQTLGFFLGVFGSAFTLSEGEFLESYKKQLPFLITHTLAFLNEHTSWEHARISPAQLHNPIHAITGIESEEKKEICLVDAGLDCNLPFAPLLRPERSVDIMIVCDASADIAMQPQLKVGEKYAQTNNLKFPPITYTDLTTNTLSLFEDLADNCPTLIYLPLVKNSNYSDFDPQETINSGGYCATFNLQYTPEQTEQICGLSRFSMLEAKEKIIQAIYDWVMHKRNGAATLE